MCAPQVINYCFAKPRKWNGANRAGGAGVFAALTLLLAQAKMIPMIPHQLMPTLSCEANRIPACRWGGGKPPWAPIPHTPTTRRQRRSLHCTRPTPPTPTRPPPPLQVEWANGSVNKHFRVYQGALLPGAPPQMAAAWAALCLTADPGGCIPAACAAGGGNRHHGPGIAFLLCRFWQ